VVLSPVVVVEPGPVVVVVPVCTVVVVLADVLVDGPDVLVFSGDDVVVTPGMLVEVVLFTDVDVWGGVLVVVVCSGAVVVDVDEQSFSSCESESLPCTAPSNVHSVVASTRCVPNPIEMAMVSAPDGPPKVKSRTATATSSTDTTSCAVAVVAGKSWYANSTAVHEMSIVLVCADAAVAKNDNNDAVRSIGTPMPMPTAARARAHRELRLPMYCS
jgi:hypothetical protein